MNTNDESEQCLLSRKLQVWTFALLVGSMVFNLILAIGSHQLFGRVQQLESSIEHFKSR